MGRERFCGIEFADSYGVPQARVRVGPVTALREVSS